jgi:hypothetical protein
MSADAVTPLRRRMIEDMNPTMPVGFSTQRPSRIGRTPYDDQS